MMKVGGLARESKERPVHTLWPSDGIEVETFCSCRQKSGIEDSFPAPPRFMDLGLPRYEREVVIDNVSFACQRKKEIVTVGTHLKLDVVLIGATDEDFDDLVLP